MRKLWLLPATHEEAFLARYDQLMQAALHLAGNDRERAEDLLHTVFVQFTLASPDLGAIRNLDDYLFVSLRNTQISQARRNATVEAAELSLTDYDSAEIRLKDARPVERLLAEDQLWTVCQWACERKRIAKDGSILILRFFHGYYPREIALLANMSAGAVDKAIQTARDAARAWLAEPTIAKNLIGCAHGRQGPEDFLTQAQSYILNSTEDPCLAHEVLRSLYKPGSEALSRGVLAHIVSCRICLDRAGKLLGIGSLADRHPHDTIGPQTPNGPGSRPSEPDSRKARANFKRRAGRLRTLTVEHRPRSLFAAVNGLVLSSHTVGGASNRFTLCLPADKHVGFVEIHSEQGIHLLLLNIEQPPEGDLRQEVSVLMGTHAGARSLTARMDFTGISPALEILYRDPLPVEERDPVPHPVRGRAGDPPVARRWSIPDWIRMRPGKLGMTGAIALITIAAMLWTQTSTLSAAVLLGRSLQYERALASRKGTVVHRVLKLEVRSLPSRNLTGQRRIEIWNSSAEHRAVRIFDETGALTAGAWTTDDGRNLLYRKGSASEVVQAAPDARTLASLGIDEIASAPPSADQFQHILGKGLPEAEVSRAQGRYTIALGGASAALDASSFAIVEETLTVGGSGHEREIHFVENTREIEDGAKLPSGVFSPAAELLPTAANPSALPPMARLDPKLPEPAAAQEVLFAAVSALDRARAFEGEQIELRREPEGAVLVEGYVETAARRDSILAALRPVIGDPGIRVALKTFSEGESQSGVPRRVIQRDLQVKQSGTETERNLERYFLAQGFAAGAANEIVANMRGQLQSLAHEARMHGRAMLQIVQWLPESDLAPPQTHRWKEMIRAHAAVCLQNVAEIRRLLAPMFAPEHSGDRSGTGGSIESRITLMANRTVEIDQTLLSALSLSADGQPGRSLQDAAFWRSLADLEASAAEIEARTQN